MSLKPKSRLEQLLDSLDISKLANALRKNPSDKGPSGYDPERYIYSLIAMQEAKITKVSILVARLKNDPEFRYCCGFTLLDPTPSESSFSRFIARLAETPELEELFHELVLEAKSFGIIEGSHVAIDSTKVDAYETSKPKSKIIDDGTHPNWGMKRDTNGNNIKWFGWKVHVLCDTFSELPLDVIVTPANVHDGSVALEFTANFLNHYRGEIVPSYYSMDSGYDYDYIYKEIINYFDATPIIAFNPRGSFAPPEAMDADFNPICSGGFKLVYWGKDGDYLKYRCPHILGKCDCPHGSSWCSTSNYGYTLKINHQDNPRLISYPPRASKAWQLLYNKRTSVERCISRLKEHLNLDSIRSKGIKKAKVHALLNCITLVAATLVVNKLHMA